MDMRNTWRCRDGDLAITTTRSFGVIAEVDSINASGDRVLAAVDGTADIAGNNDTDRPEAVGVTGAIGVLRRCSCFAPVLTDWIFFEIASLVSPGILFGVGR